MAREILSSHPEYVERMAGNLDINLALKAILEFEEIKDNDTICFHVMALDLKGQDNEPFDQMVGLIHMQPPEDVHLALAADHSTRCEICQPVPVLIYGDIIQINLNYKYDELDCAYEDLGHLTGGIL